MESKAVVSLTNGKKAFGDNEVLKDISLTVNAGDVLAIIGPSGGRQVDASALHDAVGDARLG